VETIDPNEILPVYIELLALAYHEARNVRQLFRHNAASKAKFGAIADHLPPDPAAAWERTIHLQRRAAECTSAKDAAAAFAEEFGCSPADLAGLFASPGWKRAPGCGGPRWAAIAESISKLGGIIDKKKDSAAAQISEILALPTNTGTVHATLARLKARPR
jgi:hypothetical protein